MVKKNKLNDGQWQKLVASGGVLDEKKHYLVPLGRLAQGHHSATSRTLTAGQEPEQPV